VHAGCRTRAALIRFRHAALLLCQERVPGGRPGDDSSLEGNRLRLYRTISTMEARLAIPMHRVRLRRQEGMAERHVARDGIEAITSQEPGLLPVPVYVK